MSLTRRQKATYNAALCIIHDSGYDANSVTSQAQAIMATGIPASRAYERALNSFVDRTPGMLSPLQTVTRLIEATDDRTVAQYNVALSQYIETGDASAVEALAGVIAQDVTSLAASNGEAAPEFAPELQALLVQPEAPQIAPEATDRFSPPTPRVASSPAE